MKDSQQRRVPMSETDDDSPEQAQLVQILANSGIPDFGLRREREDAATESRQPKVGTPEGQVTRARNGGPGIVVLRPKGAWDTPSCPSCRRSGL